MLKLTSGVLKPISDKELHEHFLKILKTKKDYHFIITFNKKAIGHISLVKRSGSWHETQIIIGEINYRNKGYGTKAIRRLIKKSRRLKVKKIYLEVRPDNFRAIKAYEKSGFVKTKIKYYPKNKYLRKTLKMELKI